MNYFRSTTFIHIPYILPRFPTFCVRNWSADNMRVNFLLKDNAFDECKIFFQGFIVRDIKPVLIRFV